jgi:hypothetical protein
VNPGGEPGRDDSGLPPVDIEIPDDARDLDRDVQSYYRELRAERRQQRGLRLRGSLAKDGIILPLLACCLILALITGTLLTVFTATSDQNGINGSLSGGAKPTASPHGSSGSHSSGATSSPPAATATPPTSTVPDTVPGTLPPGATITVGGLRVPVQRLSQAELVLVPAHCDCTSTVESLIFVAAGAHARAYLVYTAGTKPYFLQLWGSLSSYYRAEALPAYEPDNDNPLGESVPGGPPASSLAAILIGPTKRVHYATGLRPHLNPSSLIEALTH